MNPTNKDIGAAKEYLRERLSRENSMEYFLDRSILHAAREIVDLCYSSNIPASVFSFDYDPLVSMEIKRIIAELEDELYEYNMALATENSKEDKNVLLLYATREINGASYEDRMHVYASKFKMELQDLIKAGLIASMGIQQMKDYIRAVFKRPYKGTIISKYPHKGFSSYERMKLLTRHTIADTWMHADHEWMLKNGAVGYMVYRGSSYPCSVCDMNVGFHPINIETLPVHPNCCCYAVPIFQNQ